MNTHQQTLINKAIDSIQRMRGPLGALLKDAVKDVLAGNPPRQPNRGPWHGDKASMLNSIELEVNADAAFAAEAMPLIEAAQPGQRPAVVNNPSPPPANNAGAGNQPPPVTPAVTPPIVNNPPAPVTNTTAQRTTTTSPATPAQPVAEEKKGWLTWPRAIVGFAALIILSWFINGFLVPAGYEEGRKKFREEMRQLEARSMELLKQRDELGRRFDLEVKCRRDAEEARRVLEAQLEEVKAQYDTSDLAAVRAKVTELTASLGRKDEEIANLTKRATQAEEAKAQLEQETKREVGERDTLITALRDELRTAEDLNARLSDPDQTGVPVQVSLRSFNLDASASCVIKVKHWSEPRFREFTLPGGGDAAFAVSEQVLETVTGTHIYEVWVNGSKKLTRETRVAAGAMTVYAWKNQGDRSVQRLTSPQPMILIGAGSTIARTDPRLREMARRK